MDSYLRDLGNRSTKEQPLILSKAAEYELLQPLRTASLLQQDYPTATRWVRMKAEADRVRERMIGSCLPWVIRYAQPFACTAAPLEDLVQAGNLGLLKAWEHFEVLRGYRFITLATWYLRNEIILERAHRWLVYLPSNLQDLLTSPCAGQRAQGNWSTSCLEQARRWLHGDIALVSIDQQGAGHEGATEIPANGYDPAEEIANREEESTERALLHEWLAQLTSRERQVLELRYLSGPTILPFNVVKDHVGLSKQGVLNVERAVLIKLKGLCQEQQMNHS